MNCLYAKSNTDIEMPRRSTAHNTDHTNDTPPPTQAGTALPTWAEDKPLSIYPPKGTWSGTALSPTPTSHHLPAMPNHGPLPPDPFQLLQLNLAFRGPRVWIHPRQENKSVLLQPPGSALSSEKKKKNKTKNTPPQNPETVLTVSIPLANASIFHNNPIFRSTRALYSTAHSRVRHCGHHHFWYLTYQETQSYHCSREKSPAPPCYHPSWPQTLIQCHRQHPHSLEKKKHKKEIHLIELPHNILLLEPDHNSLTFSDL